MIFPDVTDCSGLAAGNIILKNDFNLENPRFFFFVVCSSGFRGIRLILGLRAASRAFLEDVEIRVFLTRSVSVMCLSGRA